MAFSWRLFWNADWTLHSETGEYREERADGGLRVSPPPVSFRSCLLAVDSLLLVFHVFHFILPAWLLASIPVQDYLAYHTPPLHRWLAHEDWISR